eukprot:gene21098-5295_t
MQSAVFQVLVAFTALFWTAESHSWLECADYDPATDACYGRSRNWFKVMNNMPFGQDMGRDNRPGAAVGQGGESCNTKEDGKYKYLGGALGSDGNMYCFPCDAERVLKYDTTTDVISWQNGFQGRDGAVYAIPQRATGVLRVLPAAPGSADEPVVEVLECVGEECKDKFEGGVMGADGCIYCIPLRAKRVYKVTPGPALSDADHADAKGGGGGGGGDGATEAAPAAD